MNITKETHNELFKRKEIVFEIESEKNPSFNDMKKKLSDKFGKPEENINVFNIKGSFGKNNFVVSSYVYDSKDAFEKAIQKTGKQRREEAKALAEVKKAEAEAKKKAEEAKTAE